MKRRLPIALCALLFGATVLTAPAHAQAQDFDPQVPNI